MQEEKSSMRAAVFTDRDGTLNIEKSYLYKPDNFEFIPGVPEAIKKLNSAGYYVVVVTNQSGIARGYYTEANVEALHVYINELLEKIGARIDMFLYCPHHPEATKPAYRTECGCRKPQTGMFREAAKALPIDPARSWMVGDKESDIEFGRRTGLETVLVETGYGSEVRGYEGVRAKAFPEAVEFILSRRIKSGE